MQETGQDSHLLFVALTPDDERGLFGEDLPNYVVICDNVSCYRSNIIRPWFVTHQRMLMEFLPSYSPFLKLFSAWRWKVYDFHAALQGKISGVM